MAADRAAAPGLSLPGYRIHRVIRESAKRVVLGATREADGRPVVLKTLRDPYPGSHDLAELRREHRILERLRDVAGVVRVEGLLSHGSGNLALELEDFGRSLTEVLAERRGQEGGDAGGGPLPLDLFFPLALSLVDALSGVHGADVVHKDVAPHNILVDGEFRAVRLIDFDSASELARERQSAERAPLLGRSLPYISPERTGRMSREVDYRADYYSLGVVLFELLTGELPFRASDPLEWMHRHIGHAPPLASDVNDRVPPVLARLVDRLLAKSAEDRYQSAFGIRWDLERCREAWEESGRVRDFDLGTRDVSRIFQIPQQLYGREEESAHLLAMLDDVAHGGSGFLLVSGYSGVGKSALVNELGDAVVRRNGYLVQGKFDQFQQSTPYSAVRSAFGGLVQQLLGESEARLGRWREEILEAVSGNGRLLTDLIPALEEVLGPQPPVPGLPPAEAQNRLQLVFLSFLQVLARRDHPVVLFLDDLQWSDVPTLNLLQRVGTARGLGYLFLVGAYRSNEVDPTHPLNVALDQIRKARRLETLELKPLGEEAVHRLTADTLQTDPGGCESLAQVLHEKAQGNPFYLKELLQSLHETGVLAFDAGEGRWTWDLKAVRGSLVSENVVEFMVESLRALPEDAQEALRLASCIGNTFDLRTLAVISESSPDETGRSLQEAVNRRLLIPLTEDYRLVGLQAEGANPVYRFQHDRVQQAAYALIDEDRRRAVHLSIGRLLRDQGDPASVEEGLMEIVAHLNAGRDLITDPEERWTLAEMNLRAGRRAQASAAYEPALEMLRVGLACLPRDPWERDYDLTLALAREVQQCAYHNGDQALADQWADRILQEGRSVLTRAEVLATRSRQYATTGRMADSVQAAMAGLRLLGVALEAEPTREDVQAEIAAVEESRAGRTVAELVEAPEVEDPEARAALELFMEVFAAAFLSGTGNLFPYLVLKGVNFALVHGASPASAFNYAAYGMLLCGALGNPALGEEYGRLGVAMNERFDDLALKSRILYVYAMFVRHWNHHWSSLTEWFVKGIEAGYQSGDLLYLAYSAQDCIIWDPTLDLETASNEQRKYLRIVRDCDYQDSYDSGTLFLQMQLNFRGLTDDRFSLNDPNYDEDRAVAGMRDRGFMTGIANHHIYKAEIHAFYGDWDGARAHVEAQEDLLASAMSLPQLVRFHIVAFLTRASLIRTLPEEEARQTRERMEDALAQMAYWADNCPENFLHLQRTMEGELARLDGDLNRALLRFEEAIASARESGFRRDQGVANERAAHALLEAGLPRAAEGYLRSARSLYDQWGAFRKVEQMEEDHPWLAAAAGRRAGEGDPAGAGVATDSESLDLASVMKASRTIAQEVVRDQLWQTILQILLENAGAQRGWFVVRRDGDLFIEARAEAGERGEASVAVARERLDGEDPQLPLSILNSVLRTGESLVLEDAAEADRFASDPYVLRVRPRSVLCVPLRGQGGFQGAVYLENNLAAGAFSQDRLEVIRLLSAQASISMENARLYEDQARLIRAQERFVPSQFLENLGHKDISAVGLGEYVARTMSVLFSDLRNFTPLAERLGPRGMIEMLNRYFSRLADPIADAGGFIDSYNGDEVMALFGMPADQPVEAGIAMCRALEDFNRELEAEGSPRLVMGVGVNTGPLVLGTVGGHDRLKCGVVGDTVNTASRIEQLTRFYGASFLVGEQTLEAVKHPDRFSVRRVDRVAVKGKERGIDLFEILDAEPDPRREVKERTRPRLDEGMGLYLARDFARAEAAFRAGAAQDPADAVFPRLLERALRYRKDPPPEDWDGVESLTYK